MVSLPSVRLSDRLSLILLPVLMSNKGFVGMHNLWEIEAEVKLGTLNAHTLT
jgi:hypothetical protein